MSIINTMNGDHDSPYMDHFTISRPVPSACVAMVQEDGFARQSLTALLDAQEVGQGRPQGLPWLGDQASETVTTSSHHWLRSIHVSYSF